MATPSAHFNLTKPATTDYYDVAVVNANTDIIDTQMYNNQESAAKVMVGASANEDGESGRVPAPLAGDEEKYLKGDGTWDTPSGSTISDMTGATSSTAGTHGLVPAPSAGDNEKFLKGDGTWDTPSGGGGSSVIPNPQGGATDTLSTIEIDGTIYSIEGSGGGGNPELEETALLTTPITAEGTYTLLDNIEDYDFVSFVSGASNEADIRLLAVSDMLNMLDDNLVINCFGTANRWFNITALSGTSITITEYSGTIIHSIIGYKIKGGGGSSWTDLTAVLEAGETSLTITDSHITINGTYDFYTSKYGLNPLSVEINDPSSTRLLQPLVTQESELNITATASTNWSGFEPWKAFAQAVVNSGWIANGGSGGYWLQAEFPYKVKVSSIDFKSLDSNRSHAISRVSYSNDGDTFTDATLTSSTMSNNIGHADVSMSETAKYIRLCFDDILGAQTYPMVSQLELYGNIDSTSAGSMTITFEEQTEDISVKVRVS